jgi:formylglycine-generating enzyme required for sulfatase activity
VEPGSLVATVPIPAPGGGIRFFLGRTPVTNAEYAPFLDAGRAAAPPWWSHPDFSAPDQPVVGVTWDEAGAFAAWLAEHDGAAWRLPTAAEWEFAASGGLENPATSWGDAVPEGEIPSGPLRGPWRVGRGTSNGYGLCDIGTIVHEWCLDAHDPVRRASRGGSWRHAIRWSSPRARSSLPPRFRYSDYGFRVLREAASKNFSPRNFSGSPPRDRVL